MHRPALWRWLGWFGTANAGLFGLLGLRYLWYYPFPPELLGTAYAWLAFIGQSSLLAFAPLGVALVPLIVCWPRRAVILSIGVIVASAGLSLLFLDTHVFAEYRFHLDLLTARLFEPSTWLVTGVVFVTLLVFESMLAGIVWRRFAVAPARRGGRWLAAGLLGAWLAATGIHIWGDAVAHAPVTQFTRYLPLYYPVHAKRDLARLGLVNPEDVRERRMLRGTTALAAGQLDYPAAPLACAREMGVLPNLLVILIDGLRPDAIHVELTPELADLNATTLRFDAHYSGGNSSRMGLFSLFYGLPSTYWQTFYDLQVPPVLITELERRGYQVVLHSAVGFGSPTLIDRTVFAGFTNLPDEDPAETVLERNVAVTDGWLEWLAGRQTGAPFFGLLYYDPPTAEMPAAGPALPMDDRFAGNADAAQRWRRYRLAQRFVDREVGRVMDSLNAAELLDETIVVVASDHGYEFDDNGLGYIGHASNFSAAQLRATMMILWPGRAAARYAHRTSHHDVPVTLLEEVLGCANPPSDYSIGRNLFSGESWDWLLAGSYSAHAIVEPDQVIVSSPGGFIEILGPDYRPAQSARLDAELIEAAMQEMRRFFR